LAAVLTPPRLPKFGVQSVADADDAASDFDLLALLPEGEAAARAHLRTLDATARQADLGVYRGMLGAAARQGRAAAYIDAAVATLRGAPHDAEASRVLLAAAQLGLEVPRDKLAQVLTTLASEGRLLSTSALALLSLAEPAGRPELVEHVLRALLTERGRLGDAQLRSALPGLFAFACSKQPEQALALLRTGELEREAAIDLAAALVTHHPDPAAAARAVIEASAAAPETGAAAIASRQGDDLMPLFGAHLLAGDLPSAMALLEGNSTYWTLATSLPKERLAAAVPSLSRWRKSELADDVAGFILAQLREGDQERRGAFARLGAVLAARLQEAGSADAAAALRTRLREATAALAWDPAAWLE
jgi:hypothetical protein